MRDVLRRNSGNQLDTLRLRARPVVAEFCGLTEGDTGPNGPEELALWAIASRLREIGCAPSKLKTGNIKLE
jgi:hypothetical protein